MKFKKTFAFCLAMLALFLVACGSKDNQETQTTKAPEKETVQSSGLKIAGLKGPTTMGIVKMMEDNTDNEYQILGTPDEAVAKITTGELDIALVPSNVAANLYNKTDGAVQVAGINTLGVLYVVETGDTIQSVADLKGKTILSTGKGTTPEYVLNHILRENGIDPEKDVTVEYKSESTELANLLSTEEDAIAVLPQPYATAVQAQNQDVRIALDLNEEWEKVDQNSAIVTGVILARKEVIEGNKENFDLFMLEYKKSVDFVNSNPQEASKLIEGADIAKAPIAQKAIPLCNIVLITGQEMETKLNAYLEVLEKANPQSIGGQLPGEGFYYLP